MRPPEWRPRDEVAGATTAALQWWRERFPRRKRPQWQDERAEFLATAWCFRSCTPEQIRYVATSVLTRSKDHWPDPGEIDAEIRHLAEVGQSRRDAHAPTRTRWSCREDDPCPVCQRMPVYEIAAGTHTDHWIFVAPDCACSGFAGLRSASLWLRGIPARPEDDPVALAALHRAIPESMITEWRRTGRSLSSILQEAAELAKRVAA
ncbi:MAG: hypothetical protein IT355_12125 [Gemmatimonadaceae bacterium]|nr:hypothetical protein [Gemmatimonadaceae bacterium]